MKSANCYRSVPLGVVIGMGFLSLFMVINPGENVKEPPELNPKLIELGEKWMLEHDETLRKLADS
jgi:hypothetical protein